MKKVIAILLALVMVAAFCACGEKTPEVDVTGTYWATSCKIDSEEYPCDGEYVKLEQDGTGTVMFMETEYDIDWTLKDGALSFTDSSGDSFSGTCADGVIEGVYANMDYVYEIGGGTPTKSKLAPKADEAGAEEEPKAEGVMPEGKPVEEAEPEPQPLSGFEPVTAEIGGCTVTIVGAEYFEDSDDKDAIRFYYDFTNDTDETTHAESDCSFKAEQEGYELVSTYASFSDDVPEYGNGNLNVRPGVTIRCIQEYNCKPTGGEISFSIYDWYDEDEVLMATFDPSSLPGRPAEDLAVKAVSDPTWTEGMATEGTYDDDYYVRYVDYEVVEGWDVDQVIRVYFEFTNNSDEATSMWWALSGITCYQDGVELESDSAEDDVDEDHNYTTDIEPGETILCSDCFALTSDSPVEVEISDYWNDFALGLVVPVA